MNKIDLNKVIDETYPNLFKNTPRFIRWTFIRLFEKLLHLDEINEFLEKNKDLQGMAFIDEAFELLNFTYSISNMDIQKIPSEGRMICVANHPIGSLDSLSLLKAIYDVRPDVKIVANDVLINFENVKEFLIPLNLENRSAQRKNIEEIKSALSKEQAVIMFPAAEVSRLKMMRVMDSDWNKGAVFFARKFNAPILPVYIDAKNSASFYIVSKIHKGISRVLLSHEMFNKRNKTITLRIGNPIPAIAFTDSHINDREQIKLLKKHTYGLHKSKNSVFKTERNIIHPVDRKLIKKELNNAKLLGTTTVDDMKIILTTQEESPYVMQEIARLREVTFRKVGEGTGRKLDLDRFDKHYSHLIVWDDNELEIVGSYRIGLGKEILEKVGPEGFYTSTIFKFSKEFAEKYIKDSIELGRSFVQKKYWNTNALHYLWQGIGAYVAYNQEIKYMFGGVSLSNSYPDEAKKNIIFYFKKWFGKDTSLAHAVNKYNISEKDQAEIAPQFTGANYKEDYRTLKQLLRPTGYSVPILYKHYSELCEDDGVKFLDFAIDMDFENCIDGLILVDLAKLRDDKRERYINSFLKNKEKKV